MQFEQLPSAERRQTCLSEETIQGLWITGTGITRTVRLPPPPNIRAYVNTTQQSYSTLFMQYKLII